MNMALTVEFYGIARLRAGTDQAVLQTPNTLGDALVELAHDFPEFANDCTEGRMLREGFRANLGGARFVSDPETPLTGDCTLLIMTADAGG